MTMRKLRVFRFRVNGTEVEFGPYLAKSKAAAVDRAVDEYLATIPERPQTESRAEVARSLECLEG